MARLLQLIFIGFLLVFSAQGYQVATTCSDGLKNGDEISVDCGGSCGSSCVVDSDDSLAQKLPLKISETQSLTLFVNAPVLKWPLTSMMTVNGQLQIICQLPSPQLCKMTSPGAIGRVFYAVGAPSITLTGMDFSGFQDTGAGGVMYLSGSGATATITSCNFANNNALTTVTSQNQGGVFTFTAGSTATISCSTFSNNSAGRGGAIGVDSNSRLTITSSLFSGNTAKGGGGAITAYQGVTVSISGTTFVNSYAQTGGGISFEGAVKGDPELTTFGNSFLTVSNCNFTSNTAKGGDGTGGGVFVYVGALATIQDSYFGYNLAHRGGGLYSNNETIINIYRSTFVGNHAIYTGNDDGMGGAIRTNHGTRTLIQDCFIQNNYADQYGGGFACNNRTDFLGYVQSAGQQSNGLSPNGLTTTTTMKNVTFTGNRATLGLSQQIDIALESILTMEGVSVAGDYAPDIGWLSSSVVNCSNPAYIASKTAKCNCAATCTTPCFGSTNGLCFQESYWCAGSCTTCPSTSGYTTYKQQQSAGPVCPLFTAPVDGSVTCTGSAVGSTCTFSCKPGFTLVGKTTATCTSSGWDSVAALCFEVDECAENTDNCNSLATCTDTYGSFTCKCNTNLAGDGVSCYDADECADGTHGCAPTLACINTVGGYTCSDAGFKADINGAFYLEADVFTRRSTGQPKWMIIPTETSGLFKSATGSRYIAAVPDVKKTYPTANATIEYDLFFTRAGDYRFYVSFTGPATDGDSFFAKLIGSVGDTGVDGSNRYQVDTPLILRTFGDYVYMGGTGDELVATKTANMVWTVPSKSLPTILTLRLTMKEDGVAVDRFVVQPTSLAAPNPKSVGSPVGDGSGGSSNELFIYIAAGGGGAGLIVISVFIYRRGRKPHGSEAKMPQTTASDPAVGQTPPNPASLQFARRRSSKTFKTQV